MKKKTPSLESFSQRNRLVVEMLRGADPEAKSAALDELAGRLDDELAGEFTRLLKLGHDPELCLEILELLARELDSGLHGTDLGDEDDLDDPDDDEDAIALPGLSVRGLDELQDFLRGYYRDEKRDPRLRRKALEAAVCAPPASPEAAGSQEAWQTEAVHECWSRAEPEWRVSALFCMGQLFPVDFADEIQEGLESPLDALRLPAIAAADARDLKELGPAILEIAADPAGEVPIRLAAIEALANLRPRGARTLLERLRGGKAPFCHFAADALRHLEQNARAEALIAERSFGDEDSAEDDLEADDDFRPFPRELRGAPTGSRFL